MIVTIREFADLQKCDYQTAVGLIRFLREKNLVKETGSNAKGNGKGRTSALYDIPESVSLTFNKPVAVTAPVVEQVATTVEPTVVVPEPVVAPVNELTQVLEPASPVVTQPVTMEEDLMAPVAQVA